MWKYEGFYIAPVDASGGVPWDSKMTSNYYCSGKKGGTWYIPSSAECRTILRTSGNNDASSDVYNRYYNKVFSNAYYWTRDADYDPRSYIMYITMTSASVGTSDRSYKGPVRCVAKY